VEENPTRDGVTWSPSAMKKEPRWASRKEPTKEQHRGNINKTPTELKKKKREGSYRPSPELD
jgi:hypothetical protein